MMSIALFHSHFDQEHLDSVKNEMIKMGAPKIRAIWSESYDMWLAVEGCHRIRAAQELGLTPIIIDITNNKTVSYQLDGETVRTTVARLSEDLHDNAPRTTIIDFEEI